MSTELEVTRKLGVAVDNAIGGFHGGAVGQFGLRLPFYPLGSFDGGLQLGPFGRVTNLYLPDRSTLLPAQSHADVAVAISVARSLRTFAEHTGHAQIDPHVARPVK